ncbi:unnamed protein product [Heterotrigona itama]|uniref:Uncharacterized protein n=1 Tax=Heterotrigona itama TaxID=395501 RepID=A0A6V7H004_9HYME|nr:unnamed protein product [Heterotrigona itama]
MFYETSMSEDALFKTLDLSPRRERPRNFNRIRTILEKSKTNRYTKILQVLRSLLTQAIKFVKFFLRGEMRLHGKNYAPLAIFFRLVQC